MNNNFDQLDNELIEEFNKSYCKNSGIKLPSFASQNWYTLKFLHINKDKIVTKQEAEFYVSKCLNKNVRDLQAIRHLGKQNGFCILQGNDWHEAAKLKKGQYVFVGFDKINNYWSLNRRKETLTNFEDSKSFFNNCCATCGSEEGQPHRFTGQITFLEKGHKDPNLALGDNNIIPQCEYCNKKYKNRFVFDDFGQVKGYTNKWLELEYKRVFGMVAQ